MSNLYEEAKNMYDALIAWRRDLHQIPEIGIRLPQTVAYIAKQLDAMNVEYTILEESSNIVATIGKGDKCFLLRSDMDALPVPEKSEIDFPSANGNMHGCGHDLHATILLGAARLLKAHENELNGIVKLFFQSGEETFQGALAGIDAGILETPKVDAAFAMHVFASEKTGKLCYGEIPMAAVYGFKITLTGHGGHGSQPERCIDPINAGVEVYHALQSLIARECPPKDDAALTIGQFAAGNASNVIPETAVLQGTLRTFKKETRELLIRRIGEIVPAVGAAYRCKVEIEELSNIPSVICDPELSRQFLESIFELNAVEEFEDGLRLMGSEDFACIAEKVPSAYFVLGAGVKDSSKWLGQHNPKIVFNEECLPTGAAIYAKVAIDWLKNN